MDPKKPTSVCVFLWALSTFYLCDGLNVCFFFSEKKRKKEILLKSDLQFSIAKKVEDDKWGVSAPVGRTRTVQ